MYSERYLSSRIKGLLQVIIILVIVLCGVICGWQLAVAADSNMRQDLLKQAVYASKTISAEYLTALAANESDTTKLEYLRLRDQLKNIRFADKNRRFVYLLGLKSDVSQNYNDSSTNSEVIILVDSEHTLSPDFSPPGQVYDEAPEIYSMVFKSHEPIIIGPVSDRWGTWITAIVPINNRFKGDTQVLLGVDIDADKWRCMVLKRSYLPAGIVTFLLVIVVVVGFVLSKRNRTHKRDGIYLVPSIFAIIGVIISLFVGFKVHEASMRNRLLSFQHLADSKVAVIKDAMRDIGLIELESIGRFFEGSEYVTLDEFSQFTGYLSSNTSVTYWKWVQMVEDSHRDLFVTKEREAGLLHFDIFEKDSANQLVVREQYSRYYPITRAVPMGCFDLPCGLDLGSDLLLSDAMNEAILSGLISASESNVISFNGDDNSLFVFRPVYADSSKSTPHGFAVAVINLNDIAASGGHDNLISVDLSLVDDTISLSELQLFDNNIDGLGEKQLLFAFGKTFVVKVMAGDGFLMLSFKRQGLWATLIGMLITFLIVSIMIVVIRRHQLLEVLVEKRTFELRHSREHLSATLSSIGDGVIACDNLGRLTSINNAAEILTGWKAIEALGLPLEKVFVIVDSQTGVPLDNPSMFVLKTGTNVELSNHTTLIARNGKRYQIADSCAPIRDEAGQINGAVLVFRDVTLAYKQREELNEERERLSHILAITGTGIDIVDSDYNLHYVDNGWQRRYGNISGRKCYEYFMGADKPCESCNTLKAIETKQVFVRELVFPKEPNKVFEVHTIPVQKANGEWLAAEFKIDITNRKFAEKQMYESEARYRSVIAVSKTGAWEYNKQTQFLWCSPEYFEMLGYSASDFSLDGSSNINQVWVDLLHPDERTIRYQQFMTYVDSGDVEMYESTFRMRHINGSWVWILARGQRLISDDGSLTQCVVGTHINITEKMLAKEALFRSESIKNKMISNIGDVIVIIDRNAFISYKSPNIEKHFGWNAENLLGTSIWENIYYEDLERCKMFLSQLAESPNSSGTIELRYKHKNGSYVWIEATLVNLLHDEDINGYLGNYHDITQRKHSEIEIIKLSQAVKQSPVSVVITNLEGEIEYVNPKFTEVTGYLPAEVVKQNCRFLKSGMHNEQFYKELWDAISHKKEWRGELCNKKKNGNIFWELVSITQICNSEGTPTHYLAVKEDITHKKKSEQDLVAAKEKAEESDNLKTAFLHNLSHEIRTPLNAICGFSDLLGSSDLSTSKQEKYVSIIMNSSKQLMLIVNDILTISSIETNQESLGIGTVCLNTMIDDLANIYLPQAKERKISFNSTKGLPDENSKILTDGGKVIQVLDGLLNNALKFTHKGAVELGYYLRTDAKINTIEFYVKDTGIGIESDFHERIFERFRQANEYITQTYGGTGLGLSIAKGFAKLLNGKIRLESQFGKGSVFYFSLPYVPAKDAKLKVDDEVTSQSPVFSKIILVAEDDDLSYVFIEELLKQFDVKVARAINGKEALDFCSYNEVDMVLMDIKMPFMDGYSAAQKIKELKPKLPIVAQSAYATPAEVKKFHNIFDAYITKPIDAKLITDVIVKHFGNEIR
jgi:PAS domain S-box-containing protein